MIRTIFSLLFLLLILNADAGEKIFPVNTISKNLLEKADAVKRMEHMEFVVINTHSTITRHHYAITILNENGDSHASLEVSYDQLNMIKSIKGTLYNAAGDVVKKLKNKDIKDHSAVDDNSLAGDDRVKTHDFYYKDYPYTIEYEIEVEGNNTFMFPSWVPQQGEHFAVEQSDYTIIFPENYPVRFKAFNYTGGPEKVIENGKMKMIWKATSLPAIKVPFATASWADLATVVYLTPSDFEIAGYKGNMNTWKGFGEFHNSLNAGRDILPPAIAEKVQALTSGISDTKEKINILYNYLQQNTRYISIQLGIGGWQPFDAAYVAKNGYGDCKALTNYMHSLLKSAGIPSNYTVVYAGSSGYAKNRFVNDLPSNQFNHVILCVPTGKDSVWLECTSQQSPAGYMGDFTGNRKAVMITDKGGVVVSTPKYGVNENQQLRTIHAKLSDDGTLNLKVKTIYECIQQDRIASMIEALSEQKIKEHLEKSLSLSTYHINDFKYKKNKSALPSVEEQLDVTVQNFATISGKRIFLVPNLLNRSGTQITLDTLRKSDFVFDYAYRDRDEVEIEIPEGYEIEAGIKDISLENAFGKYSVTSKLEGNKIIYTRLIEQYSGRFPAKLQKDIIKFYQNIYKSDRGRMVLVKKGESNN